MQTLEPAEHSSLGSVEPSPGTLSLATTKSHQEQERQCATPGISRTSGWQATVANRAGVAVTPANVLLIEDDPDDAILIRDILAEAGGREFHLECAERLSAGLERLQHKGVDVVLLDLTLPDSAGMETLSRASAAAPDVPIIVLTGVNDRAAGVQAVQSGAEDCLVKEHANGDLLIRSLRHGAARAKSRKRLEVRREVLEALNGTLVLDMDALAGVLCRVTEGLGIEMAGLRLRREADWPFHVALNLPDAFLKRADWLGAVGQGDDPLDGLDCPALDCLCGAILMGRSDIGRGHFTEHGSFWSDQMSIVLSGLSQGELKGCVRDCCRCGGCESVALVPVHSQGRVIGLLYFANREAGAFSTDAVRFLEDMADSFGTTLTRQRAQDALSKSAARLGVLREVDEAILTAVSIDDIAMAALRRLPELVPCRRCSVVEFDLEARTARVLAVYPPGPDNSPPAGAEVALEIFGDLDELRANLTRTVVDLREQTVQTEAVRALTASGVRGMLIAALVAEGELIGSLNLGWAEPGRASEEDCSIVRDLADVLAIALREALTRQRRAAAEREIAAMGNQMGTARGIQQELYPASAPQVPGFDIAGRSLPALAAGGDYFDYVPMPGGFLGIAIGDVAGHGLGAALVMAAVHAYVRAFAPTCTNVSEVLGRTNDNLVAETAPDIFCTLLFARLDPRAGSIVYANAGHPPAYVIGREGETKATLPSTALPLGLTLETEFSCRGPLNLEPGDVALFCTDGVLDVASEAGVRFGRQRLLNLVRSCRQNSAAEIVEEVCQAVLGFCEPRIPADDVTVLVVKADAAAGVRSRPGPDAP